MITTIVKRAHNHYFLFIIANFLANLSITIYQHISKVEVKIRIWRRKQYSYGYTKYSEACLQLGEMNENWSSVSKQYLANSSLSFLLESISVREKQ